MDWHIEAVQQQLKQEKLDGWLLYDFQGSNSLARAFLKIDPTLLITRRFFYWIPVQGAPLKILHCIEPHVLTHLPGSSTTYLKWQELEGALKQVLKGQRKVAMEYSPRCGVPYLSKVDGGMIDLVRSFGVEIFSSALLLQPYTCVLDEEQLASHLRAADFLDQLALRTWQKIAHALKNKLDVNEQQVRHFMLEEMHAHGFITEGHPICAVNAHSADPHFEPAKEGSHLIQPGDFILIDLWCKEKGPRAIYGDITRVAVAAPKPTARQLEIFTLVRAAQKKATDYVLSRYAQGKELKGCEVDRVCREVIESAGYGAFFTHRTGHNIYTKDHGPGAHIDSLETLDERPLIPHTCFSIEPGIYLPGEFGVRLEYDIYLGGDAQARITGGTQEEIVALLA